MQAVEIRGNPNQMCCVTITEILIVQILRSNINCLRNEPYNLHHMRTFWKIFIGQKAVPIIPYISLGLGLGYFISDNSLKSTCTVKMHTICQPFLPALIKICIALVAPTLILISGSGHPSCVFSTAKIYEHSSALSLRQTLPHLRSTAHNDFIQTIDR